MSIRRLKKSFSLICSPGDWIYQQIFDLFKSSKRLVWETTVPKILVAGQDIHLLGTRATVLAKTGADVISCMGSQTVGMVRNEKPNLLVLCHSLLAGNDAHSIADEIRTCCKSTKILMVLSELESDLPIQNAKFDAICSSSPERLIILANELLGGTLPHARQIVKRDESARGKSELTGDYQM